MLEVRADRSVVLDESYIPPILFVGVSGLLGGFTTQLQGLLHQRADALAGRVSEAATRGAAEIADYFLLQICNRYEPLITHLAAAAGQIHPESLYRIFISLAGELATFTESPQTPAGLPALPARRPARDVPSCDRSAAPGAFCRDRAECGANSAAGTQIRHPGGADSDDRSLVTDATWVLVVKAQVPAETLRRNFPNQVKIGPVEQIAELINVALPGIEVSALPVVPRQLPFYAGTILFRTGP